MVIDTINCLIKMPGCLFILANVIRLHKDKKVCGVSLISIAFFTAWSYWDIAYYPIIGQHMSGMGAAMMAVMNTVWLGQIIYYNRKEKRHGR